ncbi:type I-C CRISPR-associated endonuclease Cas1c [Lacticaseibacillus zhaodongensis]|uniref:type I-C CRISPR-associated endonuclease Cas1c n=1 Tax=Lacticaseibacillus zhaodongensis TaxID=2668065 RepID=UPI0012D30461|nr:type I-C CRISPR-associated endonuclease Cas1c [Lacticaseibacillus zhaodongensis]
MRKLLNTLYVNEDDSYLHLKGKNVAVSRNYEDVGMVPLINLEDIVTFGRSGASPALISECLRNNIGLTFMNPEGQFLGRITGTVDGNLVLRKQQYRDADDAHIALFIAQDFITGKLFNQRWMIERSIREHKGRANGAFRTLSANLRDTITEVRAATSLETLRGIEGQAAHDYFAQFNNFILNDSPAFTFTVRSRRPPLDRTNAMLSLGYSLLEHECDSALAMVGLDPYIGFMHQDRPGRESLAMDLMEEMRSVMVDRFVIKLINKRIAKPNHFKIQENGAVLMTDVGRKLFLTQWQTAKQEKITHPFLKEKVAWGLVPYIQALLLARYLRKDLDEYPPFMWK